MSEIFKFDWIFIFDTKRCMFQKKTWLSLCFCFFSTLLFAATYTFGDTKNANGLSARIESDHLGLVFNDAEKATVLLKYRGQSGAVSISIGITDYGSEWSYRQEYADTHGNEQLVELPLPGNGLYRLAVTLSDKTSSLEIDANISVLFPENPPIAQSGFGVFYVPLYWLKTDFADPYSAAAENIRRIGISWARLNFYGADYQNIQISKDGKTLTNVQYPQMAGIAGELKKRGLSIMGEIAGCPQKLSSCPDDTTTFADAGPAWGRTRPYSYALWDQLMKRTAADFGDSINVWEIWNEPDLAGRYWTGTASEFAELVKHTSVALKRGNPNAKVAVSGFWEDLSFVEKLFALDAFQNVDILSIHYATPARYLKYQELLKKHNLNLAIWISEEKEEIPVDLFAAGAEKVFKFMHVDTGGYAKYRPLANADLTLNPAAVWYSVSAHLLGSLKYTGTTRLPENIDCYRFQSDTSSVFVLKPVIDMGTTMYSESGKKVQALITVEPVDPGIPCNLVDKWGHAAPLRAGQQATEINLLPDNIYFLSNAKAFSISKAKTKIQKLHNDYAVFEAEKGRWSEGWSKNERPGFSNGQVVELWTDKDTASGYWAETDFDVNADGQYTLYFNGSDVDWLAKPQAICPFSFFVDGNKIMDIDAPVKKIESEPFSPYGTGELGTVSLAKGPHVFRILVQKRRAVPDTFFSLWFDALIVKKK